MRSLHVNGNPDLTRDLLTLESEPISNRTIFPEPKSELLDRLAPHWQLRLHDGAVIDHILKMINKPRPSRSHDARQSSQRFPRPAVLWFSGALIGSCEEAGMIALTLVRAIERHANELSAELVTKLATSPRTNDLRKVPVAELQRQIEGVLLHLSEWLLTKTAYDIERRYLELAERRASQGVALSDFCWAIVLTKEHLWEFLERQGFRRGPVEIYGEMELLHLLDQFFDRALCFATEGYEQYSQVQD
jgi:hypothetical protein